MATLNGSSVEGSTVYNSEKGRFVTLTGSGIVAERGPVQAVV
jgi:hypothetical protein